MNQNKSVSEAFLSTGRIPSLKCVLKPKPVILSIDTIFLRMCTSYRAN